MESFTSCTISSTVVSEMAVKLRRQPRHFHHSSRPCRTFNYRAHRGEKAWWKKVWFVNWLHQSYHVRQMLPNYTPTFQCFRKMNYLWQWCERITTCVGRGYIRNKFREATSRGALSGKKKCLNSPPPCTDCNSNKRCLKIAITTLQHQDLKVTQVYRESSR